MELIDKSALVAEIKKHRVIWDGMDGDYCKGQRLAYSDMISILNTLEVKEVDLEEEIKRFTTSKELYEADSAIKAVAKHFFELGMQTKEGNTLVKAKGFLVRDKDDYTAIYSTKPERGKTEWVDENHPRNANESSCLFTMDARILPNVEFYDEPVEVEVTITKKGE